MNDLKRYALVIGNFNYENLETLKTPENDCTAIGEKLKDPLGFQVTSAVNTTLGELYSLLGRFAKQANDNLSDIVLYYSGHGCSIQGRNYIMPVDGLDFSEPWANRTYISLEDIINSLVQFRRLDTVPIVVILDCCRSEPITQDQEHQSNSLVKDDGRHTNIFIMYATGSNQVASDGNGRNGAFTELLLTHMDTDKDIETISKSILTNLHNHPSYRDTQISWTGSSLLKPYNFRTASKEHKIHNLNPIPPQENVFWPKYPENLHFVDRPEVFKELESAIKTNRDNNQLRTIALCGLGGMGKSQIALSFCYRNKDNYRYIFWIDADTETALQSSFLYVAKMLDPPGFVYTKPEDIVPQMIAWFHNNDGWLLVFDNCDDYSLGFASESRRLQNKYLPKKGKGVILMTTRNNFAEVNGPAINLDEMKMDNNTALELLMRKKIEAIDIDPNALEIVKQLGHLPLAIDLTGALMKMERLTPADFLKRYNEDPIDYLDLADIQEQTGSSYGKTVLTVWKVSLDRIKIKNPLAISLLQSIAFLYPDNIPLALFHNRSTIIFKMDKALSMRSLNATVNLLQSFSLIRWTVRESNIGNSCMKNILTIHRLVQKVILLEMELQEKLQCCERLVSSLSHEVPSELLLNDEGSRSIMEAYVPHIRHVVTLFSQLTNEQCSISKELISLLSPTIVYLTRQGLFEGVEHLAKLCVSTSETKNGELHSDTAAALSKLSYVYVSQGHFKLAEPHCIRSLKIRRKIFGPIHKDTISSLHDLAYIYSNFGMERHATQLYWEAAITGDQDAQRALATRYYHGIGAPIHEELSSYWKGRSLENKSPGESSHFNIDVRVDHTPLHHAAQQGDVDKIRTRIADYKQYAAIKDRDGKLALHIAAENGNIEVFKLLVKELELDVDSQDYNGQTSLHLAAKNGQNIMVISLITELGADYSIMDINEKTSAQLAVENGHLEIIKSIVLKTAIINLDFEGNKIGDEGARALAENLKQNRALTNLNLHDNGIGSDGARILAESLRHNTALANLNLERNNVGEEGAHALAESLKQNTALTNLNLRWNNIGEEGARALAESLKQNTVLTKLNLRWNNIGEEGTRALAESLKQNTSLTNLNLERNDIGEEGAHALAESLKQNTAITNLNLELNNIGEDGARALAESLKQNTALTNLNLEANNIDKEGARALAESLKQNTTLTNLNLEGNTIGKEGAHALAESLKQNTTLTNLNLDGNNVGEEGARALAESLKQNTTLTNLNLEGNNIGVEGTRALAESLKQNIALTNLSLGDNGIGTEGARALTESLKHNTALTNLNLENNSIGTEGARALAESLKHNTVLTNLNLERNDIGEEGSHALVENLKQNTALTNLNLEENNIGEEGSRALAEAMKLKSALTNINVEDISDKSVVEISKQSKLFKENQQRESHGPIGLNIKEFMIDKNKPNTSLEYLNDDIPTMDFQLNSIDITEIGFWNQEIELVINGKNLGNTGAKILSDFLKQNITLTNLNFGGNEIGNEGARSLAESLKQNTALTDLNLEGNDIGEEGSRALAESLKQNTTLANLNLEVNNIGEKGARVLAESLKQNIALTNLNLSYNNIGTEGTRFLAESLKQNTALTNLNLYRNDIGEEGVRVLVESLKQNTTLTNLNLEMNNIGEEGASTLAECLKQNTALTNLNLKYNGIATEGACALAESLEQNTTLTHMNLSYNRIDIEGSRAIAESLKQNTALTNLNLEMNNIGEEGARALAESLKQNTALSNLNLEGNDIGEEGTHALAESLKQNTTLTNLNLDGNNIDEEDARTLAEALRRNKALTNIYQKRA